MKMFSKETEGMIPMLWLVAISLILSACAFGVEASEFDPPIWLKPIVEIILGVPIIGPFLLGLLKWTAIVAAVMTAISAGFMVVAKAFEKAGIALGFVKFAETIRVWYDKIFPIVAWLSVFNVPKKKK